jgi:hypothetical protein
VVELLVANEKVVGSNPIVRSNIWPCRLMARISGFHPEEGGSKPLRATKYIPRSSNGRTSDSDSANGGSSPSRGSILLPLPLMVRARTLNPSI